MKSPTIKLILCPVVGLIIFTLASVTTKPAAGQRVTNEPAEEQVYFIDLQSRDTIHQANYSIEGLTIFEFDAPEGKTQHDAVMILRAKTDGSGSCSTIVPMERGQLNRYVVSELTPGVPLSFTGEEAPKYLSFLGNPYLDDYAGLMNTIAMGVNQAPPAQADTAQVAALIDAFYAFNHKYEHSAIIAYHVLLMADGGMGKTVAPLSKETRSKWAELLKEKDDAVIQKIHR